MSGIVYRSQKGSRLTSNEVDGNFQYLEGLVGGQGNVIITETGFSLVGQDLTINAGWEWKILNQSYSNASAVVLNIPLAASGNQRIDIIVANQSGSFERVSGIESASNPSAPAVPTNKLVVTFLNVNDGEILDPDLPILGTQFKKKSESAAYNDPTLSGSDAVIPLQPNGQSVYAFSNAGLVSIDGFSLDLITGNPSAEVPYPGKDILIYNNKAGNLTLKHDGSGTADVKFLLENGVDLVVPAGGKVWLKYGPSYCEMIFKSWSTGSGGSDILIASANNILNDNTSAGNVARYTFLVPAGTIKKGARLDFWARITKVNNVAVADNFRIYHTNDFSVLTQTVVATLAINANLYSPFQRAITFDETTGNMFVFGPSTSQNSDTAASTTAPLEFTFDTEVDNWFSVFMQVNTSNVMNMRDFKVKLTNPL